MPYLVDGNNLAHALGLSHDGLADRQACARMISDFCRSKGARATIVFDGAAVSGPGAPATSSRAKVVFSGARSADETILRLVEGSEAPRDFTVVTSDKSLGDKARHRGATVERTHEFARRLVRPARNPAERAYKPAAKESAAEIDAWLAVFDPGRK